MGNRIIQPVLDNKDKQRTYAQNKAKYKKAIAGEFYFEAILIDYAMLEDRLRSFLYYIALLKSKDSYKVDNHATAQKVRAIVAEYKEKGDSNSMAIINIKGKMIIVRSTLLWAKNSEEMPDDFYLSVLKKQYEATLDIEELLIKLNDIADWCAYRNEVIHALLNKNTTSLMQKLPHQAQQGMELAVFMDNQVKKLKRNNKIRRELKLPI